MINVSAVELEDIRNILSDGLPTAAKVFAFGSRVKGTHRPFSDLDLAVDASIRLPVETLFTLKESFSDSDLPYRVDVVDMANISAEFRAHIESHFVEIQLKSQLQSTLL